MKQVPPPSAANRSLATFLTRLVVTPLGFLTSVIVTRALVPEDRGVFALAILTVSAVGTLLGSTGSAAAARIAADPVGRPGYVRATKQVALLFAAAGVVVAAVALLALPESRTAVLPLSVGVLAVVLTQSWVQLLMLERNNAVANRALVASTLATLVTTSVLLVAMDNRLVAVSCGWVAGQAAGLTYLVPRRPASAADVRVTPGHVAGLSLRLGAINCVSLLNYRVELLVLQAYLGLHDVGVYAVAVSVAELIWLVSAAIAGTITASVVEVDHHDAVRRIARGLQTSYLLVLVFGLLLAAVTPLVPLVFGDDYAQAVLPALLLLPGVCAFAPGALLSQYFTVRMASTRVPLIGAVFSTALTASLCMILIPALGMRGAALATSLGYSTTMALALGIFVRREGLRIADVLPSLHAARDTAGLMREAVNARLSRQ